MEDFDHDFAEPIQSAGRISEVSGDSADTRTQTIDLNSLFTGEVWETGSFNLRGMESSSLGKLLDALPIPALLVDNSHCIMYCNHSWTILDGDAPRACGGKFMDLIALSEDAERANKMLARAAEVLEKAFKTRRQAKLEAILRTGRGKKWTRIHLRAVRIASRRYLLALIEDITAERTRERLGHMEEQRLRDRCRRLQEEVRDLKAQIQAPQARDGKEEERIVITSEIFGGTPRTATA